MTNSFFGSEFFALRDFESEKEKQKKKTFGITNFFTSTTNQQDTNLVVKERGRKRKERGNELEIVRKKVREVKRENE